MEIKIDDLEGGDVLLLLQQHLDDMAVHSPPESTHALDATSLREPNIMFWSAREENELLGCGALKEISPDHGEIKSMRTVPCHLRKGVAAKILNVIVDEAKFRGYRRVCLETGSMEAFEPARKLYQRNGFDYCEPFGDYVEDRHSVFMALNLPGEKIKIKGRDTESA